LSGAGFYLLVFKPLELVLCRKIGVTAVTPVTSRINIDDFCYRLLPLLPLSMMDCLGRKALCADRKFPQARRRFSKCSEFSVSHFVGSLDEEFPISARYASFTAATLGFKSKTVSCQKSKCSAFG
jgi:hypothetical protein